MCSTITLPDNWQYRGEGNANIVLSLPSSYEILRLRKEEKSKYLFGRIIDWFLRFFGLDSQSIVERQSLAFYNDIMVPVFGNFASSAYLVYVAKETAVKMNAILANERPEKRKAKSIQYGRGAIFTDYAFLPKSYEQLFPNIATYAVEIKPKQATIEQYGSKCQFCLHQHLKLKKMAIKEISNYCPLDLFSGDEDRMKKSLKALIANPQNNFKVFQNGRIVYDENINVLTFYQLLQQIFPAENKVESFCELLIQMLLKPIDRHNNNFCTKCEMSCRQLPVGCVLHRIHLVQTFDEEGLETFNKIYELQPPKDWHYIEPLLQKLNRTNESCLRCLLKNCAENELILVPYLIASIANDCSFMLTFKQVTATETTCIEVAGCKFLTDIGVFDLYPKPASVIPKHRLRNAQIKHLSFY